MRRGGERRGGEKQKQMETISAKRKKRLICWVGEEDEKEDRISHLPDSLLHHILLLLPLKTISQMCVLSKRWKFLWLSLPDLDFPSSLSHSIHHVLRLRPFHSGLRLLRFRAPLTFSRLSSLMRLATHKHHVQELDVEVSTNDYFNFPRCVISTPSLRVFKLKSTYPGFRLPPPSVTLGGFQMLNTLSLSLVILYNQPYLLDFFTDPRFPLLEKLTLDNCFGLKQLKVSCRLLQDFNLENCFQLDGLEVLGNKLRRLKVVSCFNAYSEESWVKIHAPNLASFLWDSNAVTLVEFLDSLLCLEEASVGVLDVNSSRTLSLFTLLSGLSHAHTLALGNQCVEILSSKRSVERLLHPFHNTRSLELHTCFNRQNVHGLACLFKSCPMLHTLLLNIINDHRSERRHWNKDMWDTSTSYWESQSQELKPFLEHLSVVKINGFLECENEVSLAMFVLKHGKALREMTLRSGCLSRDSLWRQMIRSQMMGFSKASSKAKLLFH